jgi:hypothetical protein
VSIDRFNTPSRDSVAARLTDGAPAAAEASIEPRLP